jgi:hypothetical protein
MWLEPNDLAKAFVNGNNLCNYKTRTLKNYKTYQYQVSKKSGDVVNDLELEGAIVICYHHQNFIAQQKTQSFQIWAIVLFKS